MNNPIRVAEWMDKHWMLWIVCFYGLFFGIVAVAGWVIGWLSKEKSMGPFYTFICVVWFVLMVSIQFVLNLFHIR